MKLDIFVSESLKAIYEAVKISQEKSGVPVSRATFRSDQPVPPGFVLGPVSTELMPVIEFDIAVTVDTEADLSAGIGGALTVVGVGVKGKLKATESTVSRIRFSIPVNLPIASENSSSDKQ
jgi:hypothetical protein